MAGNGDLIRSMRAGGGSAMAAALELMRRAQAGAVSPQELTEVRKLVTSPELQDAFKNVASELAALLSPGDEAVFRDVRALTPDTARLTDAEALPERFLADLTLVRAALLDFPGLTRQDKAARAYAFLEAYASRFAQLTDGATTMQPGTPQPLVTPELQKALARFDKALTRAGFHELRAADGRTGVQLAHELLRGRDPKPGTLDAPAWKDNTALAADVARQRQVQATDVKPVIIPHVKTQAGVAGSGKAKENEPKSAKRRTDKVLGGRMLWNALHLMRGDELDDVAKKDAMTQLAIAAGLLLGFIAIVVGLLVWL